MLHRPTFLPVHACIYPQSFIHIILTIVDNKCMGEIEKNARKRRKRNQIAGIVLRTIETAGLISMAVIAPNVVGAIGKMGLLPHQRDRELIKRTVDRLYEQGHLKHQKGKLALTSSGKSLLEKVDSKFRTWGRPKHWDKRWRVVIFDIPEKRRKSRDQMRTTLQSIGFEQLQRSVWVYPYDCEDWVALWKADFQIGTELLYMIAETIEGEDRIKRKFDLN